MLQLVPWLIMYCCPVWLVNHPLGIGLLPGQTGCSLGSLVGNSIPTSHRDVAVASVGPISGVSRSRGAGGGNLPAANLGIPRFRA